MLELLLTPEVLAGLATGSPVGLAVVAIWLEARKLRKGLGQLAAVLQKLDVQVTRVLDRQEEVVAFTRTHRD
ncbi:MAG: hypothetical protein GY773_18075 [Actinomycetia bacterium]|nr:hypothetical protein [Actinomycetes bacterium]